MRFILKNDGERFKVYDLGWSTLLPASYSNESEAQKVADTLNQNRLSLEHCSYQFADKKGNLYTRNVLTGKKELIPASAG